MKKITLIFAALAAICACNKSQNPVIENVRTFSLTVDAGFDAAKAHFGTLADNKYPMIWDQTDVAAISEYIGTTKTQEKLASKFQLISDTEAKYVFDLIEKTDKGTYTYAAVVPASEDKKGHGYRDSKDGNFSYALVTASQTPLADGPDPATNVLAAKYVAGTSQPQTIPFTFKHVVSFGKMTVKNFPALASGETVTKITITAPASQTMSGRLFENIETGELTKFSTGSCKNYVDLLPTNITFNTTGFDIWFATFPISIAKDELLSVSVVTSAKTYTANLAVSNAVNFPTGNVVAFTYDWEKGQPKKETKTLEFDFTPTAMESQSGWPTAKAWYHEPSKDSLCVYKLNKVDYTFKLCYYGATSGQIIIDEKGLVLYTSPRYVGLPVLQGYKLITAVFTQGTEAKSQRMSGISKDTPTDKTKITSVTGGEAQAWSNATHTYNLTGTSANTMYYWYCSASGVGATKIKLTYEKVD